MHGKWNPKASHKMGCDRRCDKMNEISLGSQSSWSSRESTAGHTIAVAWSFQANSSHSRNLLLSWHLLHQPTKEQDQKTPSSSLVPQDALPGISCPVSPSAEKLYPTLKIPAFNCSPSKLSISNMPSDYTDYNLLLFLLVHSYTVTVPQPPRNFHWLNPWHCLPTHDIASQPMTSSFKIHDIVFQSMTSPKKHSLFLTWRRKWQPTPVFLPGESHGQRSLGGYSPRGRKESDTTERLHTLTHSLSSLPSCFDCIPPSIISLHSFFFPHIHRVKCSRWI